MADEVENFFGCYMLVCENPKYKGRVYIGFTVDPNRRIKQHNKGVKAGGAWRTSKRGPWNMVLIIYGFPNEISALRFEWAWQHPGRSRRLRFVKAKTRKETRFEFQIRVVSEMLRTGPWNRLPLTIRWLDPQYAVEFEPNLTPPIHMPLVFGPVARKKVSPATTADENASSELYSCYICKHIIQSASEVTTCLLPECTMTSHLVCLAGRFLGNASKLLIPVEGTCPKCKNVFLWGDMVRHKQGCYRNLSQAGSTGVQIDMDMV